MCYGHTVEDFSGRGKIDNSANIPNTGREGKKIKLEIIRSLGEITTSPHTLVVSCLHYAWLARYTDLTVMLLELCARNHLRDLLAPV